jgi:hypothetical protein
MSILVTALLVLAGLSEAAGRVLPIAARRPGLSRRLLASLVAAGALVEATVIGLWPVAARAIADLASSDGAPVGLKWTPELLVPLVLAAVIAFPLLGPLLHAILVVGVGIRLAGRLSAEGDLPWVSAVLYVAAGGLVVAAAVWGVRCLVATLIAVRATEIPT